MALLNPNNSSEVLYGSSGDVRNELNAYASPSFAGHYVDENEVPGSSIIRALARATHIIDTYLEAVYADQIPFTAIASVPVFLDDVASDLATYYAWRANSARLRSIPEDKKDYYYDTYMREPDGILPMLRDRKMQLPELTSQYADEVQAVRDTGRAPIFDVDDESNWNVDPDLLDDISEERES